MNKVRYLRYPGGKDEAKVFLLAATSEPWVAQEIHRAQRHGSDISLQHFVRRPLGAASMRNYIVQHYGGERRLYTSQGPHVALIPESCPRVVQEVHGVCLEDDTAAVMLYGHGTGMLFLPKEDTVDGGTVTQLEGWFGVCMERITEDGVERVDVVDPPPKQAFAQTAPDTQGDDPLCDQENTPGKITVEQQDVKSSKPYDQAEGAGRSQKRRPLEPVQPQLAVQQGQGATTTALAGPSPDDQERRPLGPLAVQHEQAYPFNSPTTCAASKAAAASTPSSAPKRAAAPRPASTPRPAAAGRTGAATNSGKANGTTGSDHQVFAPTQEAQPASVVRALSFSTTSNSAQQQPALAQEAPATAAQSPRTSSPNVAFDTSTQQCHAVKHAAVQLQQRNQLSAQLTAADASHQQPSGQLVSDTSPSPSDAVSQTVASATSIVEQQAAPASQGSNQAAGAASVELMTGHVRAPKRGRTCLAATDPVSESIMNSDEGQSPCKWAAVQASNANNQLSPVRIASSPKAGRSSQAAAAAGSTQSTQASHVAASQHERLCPAEPTPASHSSSSQSQASQVQASPPVNLGDLQVITPQPDARHVSACDTSQGTDLNTSRKAIVANTDVMTLEAAVSHTSAAPEAGQGMSLLLHQGPDVDSAPLPTPQARTMAKTCSSGISGQHTQAAATSAAQEAAQGSAESQRAFADSSNAAGSGLAANSTDAPIEFFTTGPKKGKWEVTMPYYALDGGMEALSIGCYDTWESAARAHDLAVCGLPSGELINCNQDYDRIKVVMFAMGTLRPLVQILGYNESTNEKVMKVLGKVVSCAIKRGVVFPEAAKAQPTAYGTGYCTACVESLEQPDDVTHAEQAGTGNAEGEPSGSTGGASCLASTCASQETSEALLEAAPAMQGSAAVGVPAHALANRSSSITHGIEGYSHTPVRAAAHAADPDMLQVSDGGESEAHAALDGGPDSPPYEGQPPVRFTGPSQASGAAATVGAPFSVHQLYDIMIRASTQLQLHQQAALQAAPWPPVAGIVPKTQEQWRMFQKTAVLAALPGTDAQVTVELNQMLLEAERAAYTRGLNQGIAIGQVKGYARGFLAGKEEAYQRAFKAGFKDGHSKGHEAGFKDGHSKGHEAGFHKGVDRFRALLKEKPNGSG